MAGVLAGVGAVLSGIGIPSGKSKGTSPGLAIAGLVCGIIALIPAVIIPVALLAVGSEFATYAPGAEVRVGGRSREDRCAGPRCVRPSRLRLLGREGL